MKVPWTLLLAPAVLSVACGCNGTGADGDGSSTAAGGSSAHGSGGVGAGGMEAQTPTSVVFSPVSGTFTGTVSVTVSTDQPGVEIRYTTDGTAPTPTSPLFEGTAISLSRTTQIRAALYRDGLAVETAAAVYVASAVDVTVDVPILVLDDYGAGEPDREFVDTALLVYGTPGTTLSGAPTLATRAAIHLRGNSSTMFDKPPYRLELRDASEGDADHELLGMPAESDWALRNPYADKALIRDAFFYGLGRDMGLQAPRFAFCEVFRNVDAQPLSPDDYLGVYLLVETIKNQKDRLNLNQLGDDDRTLPEIAGGYIFKFEWQAAEEPILDCANAGHCWQDLEVVDPNPLTAEQEAWLAEHLVDLTDALFGESFADPNNGYAAYIDVGSFVDHVVVNELGREMDAYVRSQYFYKDRDAKIFAGPLWDRDLTFDVGGFFGNREVEGFMYQSQFGVGTDGGSGIPIGWGTPTSRAGGNDWFPRLLEDPGFQAVLAARWRSLRGSLLSDAELDARIANLTAPLVAAAARNFAKWDILDTEMVGPFYTPTEGTWEGQVSHLRDWMHQRVAWLDTQWQ